MEISFRYDKKSRGDGRAGARISINGIPFADKQLPAPHLAVPIIHVQLRPWASPHTEVIPLERFAMRFDALFLKAVDEWRRKQRDQPSRAAAIRGLVERGLASTTASRHVSKGGRRKAAEMAEQEIDRLSDQTATNEERARRKRRLLKGPREFRDLRADLAKIKG